MTSSHDRDEPETGDDRVERVEAAPAPPRDPKVRRHLIVLGIALVGFVVGVVLVVTGRSDDHPSPAARTAATAVARGPLLRDLGSVADLAAAKTLVARLDPSDLRPSSTSDATTAPSSTSGVGSSTTRMTSGGTVELTTSGLQRCQQAIAQQNTDRSLGSRRAAARMTIGAEPVFVVTYVTPASGSSPAGSRVVLVDARTCRVLTAIQH